MKRQATGKKRNERKKGWGGERGDKAVTEAAMVVVMATATESR